MCLFDQNQNPQTRRRSRAFIFAGMVCLTLGVLWQNLPFGLKAQPDLSDFFKGLLYGLSLAFSIGALFLARRSRFNR